MSACGWPPGPEHQPQRRRWDSVNLVWRTVGTVSCTCRRHSRNLPDEQKPPRHVGLNHVEQGQLKVREQDEWIWTRRLERYQPMAQSVYNAASAQLAWNGARKLPRPGNSILALPGRGRQILPAAAAAAAARPGPRVRPEMTAHAPLGALGCQAPRTTRAARSVQGAWPIWAVI